MEFGINTFSSHAEDPLITQWRTQHSKQTAGARRILQTTQNDQD